MIPENELDRTSMRPDTGPRGPLAAFYVEVDRWDESSEFARRVRSLVRAGVEVSMRCDFDMDELPEIFLPSWVNEEDVLETRRDAELRYALHRGAEEWAMQDLLFSFDPRQRSWEWWDATQASGNVVQIWVDSRGEPVFACDELRWILYLSGARSVVGPLLVPLEIWERQQSVGISSA
ncbi:hypothetical protein ACFWOL_32910 [Streptomyces sp. NPDC058442]|uniref:hypothetical protein n=1 Tax=Streptomyces sp. NPDC058442 TaxID=3346503 RepID=UPI00364959A7